MTITVEELTALAENTYYSWTQQADGCFAVLAYSTTTFKSEVVRTFTAVELAELSPKIPLALSSLLQWNLEGLGNDQVQGDRVKAIIRLSLDDVVQCRNLDGRPSIFQDIYSYTPHPDFPDRILLAGVEQTICVTFIGGAEVSFVTRVGPAKRDVLKAELDVRYPGWPQRWAVGEALDLNGDELRRYIFPSHSTPRVSPMISDLQFDTDHES